MKKTAVLVVLVLILLVVGVLLAEEINIEGIGTPEYVNCFTANSYPAPNPYPPPYPPPYPGPYHLPYPYSDRCKDFLPVILNGD